MVNRSDLIDELARQHQDIAPETVKRCVTRIQNAISDKLKGGGRVEIRGFGSFFLTHYQDQMFRNPRSGKKQLVLAHSVPRFKPGLYLRQAVNLGPAKNRRIPPAADES